MASLRSSALLFFIAVVATTSLIPTSAKLTTNFYNKVCPEALPAIRRVVKQAIYREPRLGASLLRLHFHDCFVNVCLAIACIYGRDKLVYWWGCDGSILLDDAANFKGEKTALPNANSVRGFKVIDDIKKAVNKACKGNVISCADILAVAARDSVNILQGPQYIVLLGRRDARNASLNDANRNLPPPFFNFVQLLSSFQSHGLNLKDLVVLSAAHTIGQARCTTVKARIYNDTNIDPMFAAFAKKNCPSSGGDDNIEPLDATLRRFDTVYFKSLLKKKGLLHSDQELFKGNGNASDKLVQHYSSHSSAFGKVDSLLQKVNHTTPITQRNRNHLLCV